MLIVIKYQNVLTVHESEALARGYVRLSGEIHLRIDGELIRGHLGDSSAGIVVPALKVTAIKDGVIDKLPDKRALGKKARLYHLTVDHVGDLGKAGHRNPDLYLLLTDKSKECGDLAGIGGSELTKLCFYIPLLKLEVQISRNPTGGVGHGALIEVHKTVVSGDVGDYVKDLLKSGKKLLLEGVILFLIALELFNDLVDLVDVGSNKVNVLCRRRSRRLDDLHQIVKGEILHKALDLSVTAGEEVEDLHSELVAELVGVSGSAKNVGSNGGQTEGKAHCSALTLGLIVEVFVKKLCSLLNKIAARCADLNGKAHINIAEVGANRYIPVDLVNAVRNVTDLGERVDDSVEAIHIDVLYKLLGNVGKTARKVALSESACIEQGVAGRCVSRIPGLVGSHLNVGKILDKLAESGLGSLVSEKLTELLIIGGKCRDKRRNACLHALNRSTRAKLGLEAAVDKVLIFLGVVVLQIGNVVADKRVHLGTEIAVGADLLNYLLLGVSVCNELGDNGVLKLLVALDGGNNVSFAELAYHLRSVGGRDMILHRKVVIVCQLSDSLADEVIYERLAVAVFLVRHHLLEHRGELTASELCAVSIGDIKISLARHVCSDVSDHGLLYVVIDLGIISVARLGAADTVELVVGHSARLAAHIGKVFCNSIVNELGTEFRNSLVHTGELGGFVLSHVDESVNNVVNKLILIGVLQRFVILVDQGGEVLSDIILYPTVDLLIDTGEHLCLESARRKGAACEVSVYDGSDLILDQLGDDLVDLVVQLVIQLFNNGVDLLLSAEIGKILFRYVAEGVCQVHKVAGEVGERRKHLGVLRYQVGENHLILLFIRVGGLPLGSDVMLIHKHLESLLPDVVRRDTLGISLSTVGCGSEGGLVLELLKSRAHYRADRLLQQFLQSRDADARESILRRIERDPHAVLVVGQDAPLGIIAASEARLGTRTAAGFLCTGLCRGNGKACRRKASKEHQEGQQHGQYGFHVLTCVFHFLPLYMLKL